MFEIVSQVPVPMQDFIFFIFSSLPVLEIFGRSGTLLRPHPATAFLSNSVRSCLFIEPSEPPLFYFQRRALDIECDSGVSSRAAEKPTSYEVVFL